MSTLLDTYEEALHAEYRAYLMIMHDHGCCAVALSFDEWMELR